MTLEQVKEKLGKRSTRKLANNTYLQMRLTGKPQPSYALLYHATDVVTWSPDGTLTLTSGGWKTVTTKERINMGLPAGFRLRQERGVWYITDHRNGWDNAPVVTFQDGMTIAPDGKISGAGEDPRKIQRLRKRVQTYTASYIAALRAGNVPAPGPGDCFYCHMREVETKKPLGECNGDADHIISHMKERYFVPSLLYRAMEVFPVSIICKATVFSHWNPEQQGVREDFVYLEALKVLRKYLYRQLGLVG